MGFNANKLFTMTMSNSNIILNQGHKGRRTSSQEVEYQGFGAVHYGPNRPFECHP